MAKKREEARYAFYVPVFQSPHGEKVLEDLERVFNVPASYTPGKTPFDVVAYNEGQKSVYRYILARLEEAVTPRQQAAIITEPEEK